jgi:hypothetical protein
LDIKLIFQTIGVIFTPGSAFRKDDPKSAGEVSKQAVLKHVRKKKSAV